ncbi:MAG: hypothetical protein AAF577_16405 [Pseudomonadota bacterium]
MSKTSGKGGEDDRAARLKAALRANLRRRKSQSRARDAAGDDTAPTGLHNAGSTGDASDTSEKGNT